MRHPRRRARPRAHLPPVSSGHPQRSTLGADLGSTGITTPPARAKMGSPRSAALRAPTPPPPPQARATFPRLTERVEVLDSGHTIRFLFLGGNGLRKAAAGEGGRGGRSVGKRGGSRGRQLSPRRRLSDWAAFRRPFPPRKRNRIVCPLSRTSTLSTPLLMQVRVMTCFLLALRIISI